MSYSFPKAEKTLHLYFGKPEAWQAFSFPASNSKEQVNLKGHETGILNYPDHSFDFIYVDAALNFIPMDQLYMLFFEAKRLVAPKGHFCISNYTKGGNFVTSMAAKLAAKKHDRRLLQVIHFVSPEDWETVHHELVVRDFVTQEFWVAQAIQNTTKT